MVRRASTGLAEEVCPSSSSRRDESERRRDASGISPADTSSRQPSGTSSRKSSAKRRGALSRHSSRSVTMAAAAPLAPLASAGESGAADSSRRGAGLSVPRTAAPADDPGRQASSRSDRSAAAARCFIRVPPFLFCKSYVTLLTLRFFYAWETAYFLRKAPYLCIVRRGGGCRISGQNFFEIRQKKLLTNPPESCIIRPSERMRGVAGVSHPGIRAFRRRCYVEQNIRKSKKRGNGVSHPGACCLAFSLLHCSRRRQDVRHAPKS